MLKQHTLHLEEARAKRSCHTCKCTIPKSEYHLAIYRKSSWGWWSERENTCFMCMELAVKFIKHFIYKKGGIKNRRNAATAELLVEKL